MGQYPDPMSTATPLPELAPMTVIRVLSEAIHDLQEHVSALEDRVTTLEKGE